MKSIGEVAREIGVSTQTIREWEKAGLIPLAQRQFPLARWRVWDDQAVREIRKFAAKRMAQGGAHA